ncbi:DUF3857 domain-containing protein [Sphingomonas sp. HF-S3]|uniref:DUF3857 domain-containing protein n=1 Tax=Sphingomonas rustica TaxID=3103142 RepID=A0ABV0BBG1_9SPHN
MIGRFLLLLAALLSMGGIAHAGDKPLYAPVPAWVTPAPAIDATKLSDQDPIILRFDQQQRVEKDQVVAYSDHALRVATSQLATQLGTLQLPWMPEQGDLTIHAVQILRGGQTIDMLAKGARFTVLQREQKLEQGFISGMLTATLTIEDLRVGDVLRVVASISSRDPALGGQVQSIAALPAAPMPVGFGRLRLLWPTGSPILWRAHLKGLAVTTSEKDGWHETLVALPAPKPADLPDDAPARFQPLPLLELSSFADWRALSKTMAVHYRTAGTIPAGSPIAAEVARIRAASPDPRTRAALALQLVQDRIRYLFRGMDNGNYVPQSPERTWSLGYGDCKAKTMLLLAILRDLGIEADASLVSLTMSDQVAQRLPAPAAFDHVIVRAVIDGRTLWLDGTGRGSRLADLDDVPPFRHALPLRDDGSDLVEMPMRLAARPTTESDIQIDQSAGIHFPAPFRMTLRTRGADVEMVALVTGAAGKEQADQMVDTLINGQIRDWSSLVYSRTAKVDEKTGVLTITAEGLVWPNWVFEDGVWKLMVDQTVEGVTFTPDRARPAWREIPVSSGAPSDQGIRTTIRLPGKGAGFTTIGNQTLPASLGAVVLSRKAGLDDGSLVVEDRISAGLREIAPADIATERRAVAQARTRLLKAQAPADTPPTWRAVELARRGKAFEPILAGFDRYIAQKPDEAGRYDLRAAFLTDVYDWPGALRDYDKAITLEPTPARHLTRSWVRYVMKDDKGSLGDIREALELEPGNGAATRALAERLARDGKLDDGLTLLAEQIDQGGDERNDFVASQASLLGEFDRGEEGVAALDAVIAKAPGNAGLLNSRCWLKATANLALESAIKDCTKSIELAQDPSAALDSRGLVYFRMGRYEEALADFDAALTQSPNMTASLYMRGITLNRQGKNGNADLAAARMMSPRIDEDYARYGIKP